MRLKEQRNFAGCKILVDDAAGIIEAYVSIMGIADDSWMNDIIEMGAFKKTIQERGPAGSNKIRVLWVHGIQEVIGLPLVIEEHGREKLPDLVKNKFPQAIGGLFTRTQIVMDVQRGREAFALYKSGAMDEWSIGFNAMDSWLEKRDKVTYRHLREIRLWEYSPVPWGANPGTTTVSVRNSLQMILEETKLAHPEYDDLELLRVLEERLSPRTPAEPVFPLTEIQGQWIESRRVQNQIDLLRLRGKI
jgi:hypothetical protein